MEEATTSKVEKTTRGRGRPRKEEGSGSKTKSASKLKKKSAVPRKAKASSSNAEQVVLPNKEEEMERIKKQQEERKQELKKILEGLSKEDMELVLVEIIEWQPGLLFDVLKTALEPGQNPPDPQGQEPPKWCKCTRCKQMPSMRENFCCGLLPRNCVSMTVAMQQYCLDAPIVGIARNLWRDVHAQGNEQEGGRANRGMRHAAYRQFVMWRYGRLGAGKRVVIYSCCVSRIRDRYPDPNGQYTGFMD